MTPESTMSTINLCFCGVTYYGSTDVCPCDIAALFCVFLETNIRISEDLGSLYWLAGVCSSCSEHSVISVILWILTRGLECFQFIGIQQDLFLRELAQEFLSPSTLQNCGLLVDVQCCFIWNIQAEMGHLPLMK